VKQYSAPRIAKRQSNSLTRCKRRTIRSGSQRRRRHRRGVRLSRRRRIGHPGASRAIVRTRTRRHWWTSASPYRRHKPSLLLSPCGANRGILVAEKAYVIELAENAWIVRNREGDPMLCGHNLSSRNELVSALVATGALVQIVDDRSIQEPPASPNI